MGLDPTGEVEGYIRDFYRSNDIRRQTRDGYNPNDHPAFSILIVDYDGSRRTTDIEGRGTKEIAYHLNELEIHTRYGMEPGYADIRLYLVDPNFNNDVAATIRIGDPIEVVIHDLLVIKRTLFFKIKSLGYENGNHGWYFRITADIPSYFYTSLATPHMSIVLPSEYHIGEAFIQIINATWKSYSFDEKWFPDVIMRTAEDYDSMIKYSHIFSTNSPVNEVMNKMVEENDMEWFYSIWTDSIAVGKYAPLYMDNVRGVVERLREPPASIQYYAIGTPYTPPLVNYWPDDPYNMIDRVVGEAILPGHPLLMCGIGIEMNDGLVWKIVKSIYYLQGDGETESHIWILPSVITCTREIMDIIEDIKPGVEDIGVNEHVKLMDVTLSKSVDTIGDSIGSPGKFYKFADNKGAYFSLPDYRQDPRKTQISTEALTERIVMSTPFAGNGIGLQFPKEDEGRHITLSPFGLPHFPIAMSMIWKHAEGNWSDEDDIIPECNPKDFYLRMHKGYLYFDEEQELWVTRSKRIMLETGDLHPPEEKPNEFDDPPEGANMTISRDPATITLNSTEDVGAQFDDSEIALYVDPAVQEITMKKDYDMVLKNGSSNTTLKDSETVVEAPGILLGAAASLKNARVTDTVDSSLFQSWWAGAVAAATSGGGPSITGWIAFYTYIVSNPMPTDVGVIKDNTSKVKSE